MLLLLTQRLFALVRASLSSLRQGGRASALLAAVAVTLAGQALAQPAITSATYNASTGVLTITATGIAALHNINLGKFTLTGEGGINYPLSPSSVFADSATAFHTTLTAADKAALTPLLNKAGTSSTSGTIYNFGAADDWDASVTAGDTSDPINPLTVTNLPMPSINSGGATLLPQLSPFTNDVDAQKLYVIFLDVPPIR